MYRVNYLVQPRREYEPISKRKPVNTCTEIVSSLRRNYIYCEDQLKYLRTCGIQKQDSDPHGSAFIKVAGSGSRRAKMTHEKSKEFSHFEVLDVLF
jgi:hypothetical protein